MKIKIKSKNKNIKRWLKRKGAIAHINDLIQQEVLETNYDSVDWIKQVLEESPEVDKAVVAWLLDQRYPISEVVVAIKERYVKQQVEKSVESGANGK